MIHVLFSSSAAGTLRQLFRSRGIHDRVVDLTEWLDTGLISSDRIEHRIEWFEDRIPWKSDWAWAAECVEKFLDAVGSDDDRLVWLAPRSAQELSGFHWFLHRTQAPPNRMIISDYPLKGGWRGEPPLCLSELDHEFLAQLLDGAPRVEWDSTRFPIDRWRVLMDDAAVLRVVEDGVLRSAKSDHYDDALLSYCPANWTKWYRVVGDTMGHGMLDGYKIDDLFLRWRLQELIESGAIECHGNLPGWDMPTTIEPAMIRRAE